MPADVAARTFLAFALPDSLSDVVGGNPGYVTARCGGGGDPERLPQHCPVDIRLAQPRPAATCHTWSRPRALTSPFLSLDCMSKARLLPGWYVTSAALLDANSHRDQRAHLGASRRGIDEQGVVQRVGRVFPTVPTPCIEALQTVLGCPVQARLKPLPIRNRL